MARQHQTVLVWFRRDLRLLDNPALYRACLDSDEVIPVYIHCPQEEAPWEPGAASNWWLHHSLTKLRENMRQQNMDIIIRHGSAKHVLKRLIGETGARAVYWNRLYEPALLRRDKSIKAYLTEQGLLVKEFNSALLNEPWETLKKTQQPYRVFTPYYKANRSRVHVGERLYDVPKVVFDRGRELESDSVEALRLLSEKNWASDFPNHWQPGESGALDRLERFSDAKVFRYALERDRPGHDGVSRMSPHLHFGEISPDRIWYVLENRAREEKKEPHVEPYLRQLMWREFAYHLLFHFPKTPGQEFNQKFENFPWREPDSHLYRAWTKGLTGIPLVDAGMRELWQTGWMHNRTRMNVASFLTKHCLTDWRAGARWFWDTLVDADLANNTMGWQWSAGCGADAAPFFRIFNPVRQGQRFDPDGEYIKRWVPELAQRNKNSIHQPQPRPIDPVGLINDNVDYPSPIVDLALGRHQALTVYKALKTS